MSRILEVDGENRLCYNKRVDVNLYGRCIILLFIIILGDSKDYGDVSNSMLPA